jgi:prolyl-tRNA editing enzyme YbaK/EbsC (Cys-tRNA(Pro) deacylase)
MDSLTPNDVQKALDTFNFGIQIRFFENSTATSQLAADEIGCQLGQIAKSICFIVEDKPVIVIASGDQRVDDRKVAALLGVSRKQVKFATPEQCITLIGYPPGGVPPLGHRTQPRAIYLDDSLKRYNQIYPAGGASNAIFGVALEQLPLITGGSFADIRREAQFS